MHLSVLRTVPEMGAEPVVMARTRPPRAAWTALNTSLSHILLFRITPLGKHRTRWLAQGSCKGTVDYHYRNILDGLVRLYGSTAHSKYSDHTINTVREKGRMITQSEQ